MLAATLHTVMRGRRRSSSRPDSVARMRSRMRVNAASPVVSPSAAIRSARPGLHATSASSEECGGCKQLLLAGGRTLYACIHPLTRAPSWLQAAPGDDSLAHSLDSGEDCDCCALQRAQRYVRMRRTLLRLPASKYCEGFTEVERRHDVTAVFISWRTMLYGQ